MCTMYINLGDYMLFFVIFHFNHMVFFILRVVVHEASSVNLFPLFYILSLNVALRGSYPIFSIICFYLTFQFPQNTEI